MQQPSLHYRTQVNLNRVVFDIASNTRSGLQFKEVGGMHRPCHSAIYHQMGGAYFPFNPSLLTDHQGTWLITRASSDVSP